MVPEELLYTEEHEWILVDGNEATIGITDFAQSELGDIVYLAVPKVGEQVTQFESIATIEAVKAVSDLYAPISGTITEVNEALSDNPEFINQEPYEEGWILKISIEDDSELEKLMTADSYKELIGE